jgi:hypothetical protein
MLLLLSGLDYTVAHYGIITSAPRLDAVLTFVDDAAPDAADAWAVGEVSLVVVPPLICSWSHDVLLAQITRPTPSLALS